MSITARTTALFLLVGASFVPPGSAQPASNRPSLRGSLLQPGLGDEWTNQRWRREFCYMGKAGLNQMVLQWTADSLEPSRKRSEGRQRCSARSNSPRDKRFHS